MALDNRSAQFLLGDERQTNDNFGDTILRLNCFGFGGSTRSGFNGNQTDPSKVDFLNSAADDGCKLVLGLGPTPSVYCGNNYYSTGINKSKGASGLAVSPQGLSCEDESILQLGLSGGTSDSLSGYDCSEVDLESRLQKQVGCVNKRSFIPIVDEGSTSAKTSGGYMPGLLLAPRMNDRKALPQTELLEFGTSFHSNDLQNPEQSATTDASLGTVSGQANTFMSSDPRVGNSRRCKYPGCSKGARGASGLCIGHGGGQRCKKPGCSKGAESKAAFCKAHGGGSRCQHLGCTKSAEGKTEFCIAHGGGRRCGHPGGCTKAARGKSGLCIRHGGGKRCKIEGCTRSAEGQAGLCISHGGGRRCQYPGCSKGAQGSTMLCKAHGGGKRCIFAGCTKGAEGSTPLCKGHGGGKRCMHDGGGICPKSVHGGTNFCVAHGGGKRCVVPGCTKSARGRTDCCVRHGGGKRCKFENCGKSAQGSTDYCKAHGGGKRCIWENGKCEKFARGKSGLCAAHSSLVLGRETKKGGLIGPGLFHGLVSATSTTASSTENTYSSSTFHTVSDCIDSLEKPAKRQHLSHSQMLIPPSVMSSSSYSTFFPMEKQDEAHRIQFDTGISSSGSIKNLDYMLPEGRVHGGGLMSLLGGNLKNAFDAF